MTTEYDVFVDDVSTLVEGKEIVLPVRDLVTLKTTAVRAILSSSAEALPNGNNLWLRYSRGRLREKPWKIKVIEELPFESLFKESRVLG